jgi:hypothetical protein
MEFMLGVAMAGMFLVAFETCAWQLRRWNLLIAERLTLSSVANLAAREALADPRAALGTHAPAAALLTRLPPGLAPDGVTLSVDRRPLGLELHELTVVAGRTHPVLGRHEARAVVILHE